LGLFSSPQQFDLRFSEIYDFHQQSRASQRGVTANRHETWARDAMDAQGIERASFLRGRTTPGERRRRVVLAPLGWCQVCEKMILQATVTNKVMDTGESAEISRNTIAQGRPGRSG
jgi:hypothetical protein